MDFSYIMASPREFPKNNFRFHGNLSIGQDKEIKEYRRNSMTALEKIDLSQIEIYRGT